MTESIIEKLRIEEHHRIIAVVGAGGKSSLINALAAEFVHRGKKTAVCTTTHIMAPGAYWPPERVETAFESEMLITVGIPAEGGKLKGEPHWPGELARVADIVLVEADGSKGLPIKFPAKWEPVIPKDADIVIGVLGAAAFGQTVAAAMHRAEVGAAALGKTAEDIITPADGAFALSSPLGQKKNVNCDYRFAVCGAKNCPEGAWETAQLLKEMGIEGAVLDIDEKFLTGRR